MVSKRLKLNQKAQLEEIYKCGSDPVYFMKNYMEIQHAERGRIPFDVFPFQEECVQAFQEHRYNVVLKSRQLGLTTVTGAYCLWLALFHRDKEIIIMATQLEVGKTMVQKIRVAYDSLPTWLLQKLGLGKLEAESVRYVGFANGSRITAIPTGHDAGRSKAVSLLVVDEAAHIENLKELWMGIKPTLSTGGSAIVFSTPKGQGNFFHELWEGAVAGENGFNPIRLPWTVHPERDEEWFKNECKGMDDRGIAQELLCSFESSGRTFFGSEVIQDLKNNARPPAIYGGVDGASTKDLWIWKEPLPGHSYLVSADIARGDADDFSAFHVIDKGENEVVAEYLGKIAPDRFGDLLVKTGTQYNTALIVQEKNSIGIATAIKLRDLKYPNLFYEKMSPEEMVYLSPSEIQEKLPGFTTTPKNRETMLSSLEDIVRNKKLRIYSERFITQMNTFSWTGKRGQASSGKSDDLIMALAIGCEIFKPTGTGSAYSYGSMGQGSWANAFLSGLSRGTRKISSGIDSFGMPEGTYDPYFGSKGIPSPPPSQQGVIQPSDQSPPQYVDGVKLKPGVNREHVIQHQALYKAFDWLFR